MIEWTISLGNIITIAGLFATALIYGIRVGTRLDYVERDLKELAGVVTQLAVQSTRLDNFEKIMILQGQRLDRAIEIVHELNPGRRVD